mmetsp:Transcript_2597/g.6283  ORF Transcript_2597/g.6283 Transcript_2597/m.6283 type:complete len:202 (-) Transcript_2597:133-738(-)
MSHDSHVSHVLPAPKYAPLPTPTRYAASVMLNAARSSPMYEWTSTNVSFSPNCWSSSIWRSPKNSIEMALYPGGGVVCGFPFGIRMVLGSVLASAVPVATHAASSHAAASVLLACGMSDLTHASFPRYPSIKMPSSFPRVTTSAMSLVHLSRASALLKSKMCHVLSPLSVWTRVASVPSALCTSSAGCSSNHVPRSYHVRV